MLRVSFFRTKEIPRAFHSSILNRIREIVTVKNGKITTIEGKILASPRAPYIIKPDENIVQNACPLCRLELEIKHTDVLILKQFVTSEGKLIPRKITKLCDKQYIKMKALVAMAQEAGLLGNFTTWEGEFDISKREGFKKFNTYYDENTIKFPFKKKICV